MSYFASNSFHVSQFLCRVTNLNTAGFAAPLRAPAPLQPRYRLQVRPMQLVLDCMRELPEARDTKVCKLLLIRISICFLQLNFKFFLFSRMLHYTRNSGLFDKSHQHCHLNHVSPVQTVHYLSHRPVSVMNTDPDLNRFR